MRCSIVRRSSAPRADPSTPTSRVSRASAAIVDGYSGSLEYLVVVNWVNYVEAPVDDATKNAYDGLLQKIGWQKLTADRDRPTGFVVSAVGVAGAPAGSAFVRGGQLAGSLRMNGATKKYDFVFTDAVDFDTESNQTRTDPNTGKTITDISPAELTIKIGAKSYTRPNPGGGVSGFHLLVLDPYDLSPQGEFLFTTNAADGAEQPAEVTQLASSLKAAADDSATTPLVILQAFGAPHGNDAPWDSVAKEMERLGGTRQVFNAMNAVDPQALNGEDPNRKGPYAFVGRVGSTAPLAEASYSLNGLPGRLEGVLMRARDDGFEPMVAAPPRSDGQPPVNTQLIHIANETHEDFPAFKDANGQPIDAASAQAVQNFLGGQGVTGLCSAALTACEIRKSYYQDYGADWTLIEGRLADRQLCPHGRPGFTAAQCNGIRKQLADEVFDVAKVTHYFGPAGLQRPFGPAGAETLANLTAISEEIKTAVIPPAADNTTANVLTGFSILANVGYAAPETTPVAAVLYAAFALGGYFTRDNGSPDLIGPKITTTASKLGVELEERYQQAGDNLNDLGRLIVSDYGKLTAVANKVDAQPGPGETDWRLDDMGQARDVLVRAAKQTIYESLVPLAYPVMYDLGQGISNARDWYCDSGPNPFDVYNKRLFNEQADGAQFVGRFPDPDPGNPWTPIIAVAQEHAVGNNADARIRGIPASITDKLFGPVPNGLGLDKLEFYSPRNGFRFLPAQPGTPALVDERGVTLPGLIEFPYNTSDFPDARILCGDIPDPPGNSG